MAKLNRLLLSLTILSLVAGSAFAAPVVIDDFEYPVMAPPIAEHVMELYSIGTGHQYTNPGADPGLPLASTLGGRRDFELTYIQGGRTGGECKVRTAGDPGQRYLDYSNTSGVESQFDLEYGEVSDLSTDLSFQSGIEFYVLFPTDVPSQFILRLWSDVGELEETEGYHVYALPEGFSGLYYMPFTDFPGINFTDVDRISFSFGFASTSGPGDGGATYAASFDVSLDFIQAQTQVIPEPTTLTLLGLAGLALVRRRRLAR
jgi:hypothetical protein